MKIFKIGASYASASKTTEAFGITVFEYLDVKETDKNYLFDGKRLNKDKLSNIDIEIHSPGLIKAYVYVLESNLEEFITLVHKKVIEKINSYKLELETTTKAVNDWSGVVRTRIID